MQARISLLLPPPQIVTVRQKTTCFSIISSVIYMLNVALSERKGQTALNHVLLLRHSSVFCKTNSLPNSVTFSPHLQELHVCGIYPSLMLFKCVTKHKFYYGFAPSTESVDVSAPSVSKRRASQSQHALFQKWKSQIILKMPCGVFL